MFPTSQEGQQDKHTNIHSSKCMDNYFFTSSSTYQNHAHMPWRGIQSSQATNTHSYTQIKGSMQYFHLPPWYESHDVSINFSLNTANLNVVSISAPEFRIWQHLEPLWNRTSLQHLTNIPLVPLDELYKQLITSKGPVNHFYLLMRQQEEQFQSGYCYLIQESM